MLNLKNLTGVLFKGEFYRNPQAVAEELKALEKYPDQFTKTEANAIQRDAGHFEFELRIFTHNPNSRLFIAGAQDASGESGIVGLIKNLEIQFNKIYSTDTFALLHDKDRTPDFAINFRVIHYFGGISQLDNIITAGGKYLMGYYNERMGGFWRMDSVQ